MRRKVVYRVDRDGAVEVHAGLSSVARGVLNDMIVGDDGSAYVGDMGLDPDDPSAGMSPGQLFKIDPDGGFVVAADDLGAPNGPGFAPPDGICIDVERAVWVADPIGGRVVRLLRGGQLTHIVDFAGEAPVACVLGGPGRRTLFICVAPEHERDAVLRSPCGRIDAVHVPVGGAGRP